MPKKHRLLPLSSDNATYIFVAVFIFLASIFYFNDLKSIPFHPDESTQIFMSSDVDIFLKEMSDLFWDPKPPDPIQQTYRLLDAPVARYLIGLGRLIFKVSPLENDWNWSNSWEQNHQANAYPSNIQLLVARISTAWFFPFSLILLFIIGKRMSSDIFGWILMVLFTLNSLILLHTRRAMSEGPLVFFIILYLWSLLRNKKSVFLSAIALAFAINSKVSAIPLIIAGVLSFLITDNNHTSKKSPLITKPFTFITIVIIISFLLNPIHWSNPVKSFQASMMERNKLIMLQVKDLQRVAPQRELGTFRDRTSSLIGNLFFSPLAFSDYGNYSENISQSVTHYLQNPLNALLRNTCSGVILLFLSLLGFVLSLLKWKKCAWDFNDPWLIINLCAVLEIIFLFLFIPLPYQRYVAPVIPFILVWITYSIETIIQLMRSLLNKKINRL